MSGEPIEQVRNGIQMLVSALRQDPYALETACLSVITFGSEARVATPLTELTSFQSPLLEATGTTSMGAALRLATEQAENEVAKTTASSKGDWRPMVFLMTDGRATDDLGPGLEKFKAYKWGVTVACAVNGADEGSLEQIGAGMIVKLDTSSQGSMAAFFKWVTASVGTVSKAVESTGKEVTALDQLPPPPPEIRVVV
jgi:uncharacterized protein YegL